MSRNSRLSQPRASLSPGAGLLRAIPAKLLPACLDRAGPLIYPHSSTPCRGPVLVSRSYFHLHLVSDSTGETLIAVARAVAAQYEGVAAIEHVYPLVRSARQLSRVLAEIDAAPGTVLYTLVDRELSSKLEETCREA